MKQLVYDLPTRVFHWLFSGLFLTAFVIAKTVNDESWGFSFHMIAGLTLGFVVLLRMVWGFVGTRYAKFSSFELSPEELVEYFKELGSGLFPRWAGHNPASSWAALAMMALGLGLVFTGFLMTSGSHKESFEDVHEILANAFLVVAGLHVLGVVTHTLRYREMIGLSMVNGKKSQVSSEDAIESPRKTAGLVFIALVIAFGIYLIRNYNLSSGKLKLFGTYLQLSESQNELENE